MPDADARCALLLILAALERHSRALRTLLAQLGGPDPEGVLEAFERRERALGEAARQLRAGAAHAAAGSNRRSEGAADVSRQGVLPLLEPAGATGADAAAGVIPGAVEDQSERLGTNGGGSRRGRDEPGRVRPAARAVESRGVARVTCRPRPPGGIRTGRRPHPSAG